jgi:AraC-like DNA-binding protein
MTRYILKGIENWPARAAGASYCVYRLAEQCRVSTRTLDRFFEEKFGLPPWDWLHEERMKRARELLVDGSTVKETAVILGYRDPSHFSRDFKKHHGYPPCQHATRVSGGGAKRKMARIGMNWRI